MTKQYDNTNSGALFKNDKREKDSHPHYKGSVNANGEEFWLSAWIKTKKGSDEKYMSLSLTAKEKKQEAKQEPSPAEDFYDDQDTPF